VYFKAKRLIYRPYCFIYNISIFCASDTADVWYFWEGNLATLPNSTRWSSH